MGLKEVFDSALRAVLSPSKSLIKMKKKKEKEGKGKVVLVPPVMPPAGRAPWINIVTSTFGDDFHKLVNNSFASDVDFILRLPFHTDTELLSFSLDKKNNPKKNNNNNNKNNNKKKEGIVLVEEKKEEGKEEEKKEVVVEKVKRNAIIEDKNYTYCNEEEISEDLNCPICYEPMIEAVMHSSPQCRNSFCRHCLVSLADCPLCRSKLQADDVTSVPRMMHNLLNSISIVCSFCKSQMQRSNWPAHRLVCKDRPQPVDPMDDLVEQSLPPFSSPPPPLSNRVIDEKFDAVKQPPPPPSSSSSSVPAPLKYATRRIPAHRVILSAASSFFGKIFSSIAQPNENIKKGKSSKKSKSKGKLEKKEEKKEEEEEEEISMEMINRGEVEGIHSLVMIDDGHGGSKPQITIDDEYDSDSFLLFLEFLYTGSIRNLSSPVPPSLPLLAKTFEIADLITVCDNVNQDNDWLNPSIGTWLNDLTGDLFFKRFFNKHSSQSFSDVIIKYGSKEYHCHRAILMPRNPIFASLFRNLPPHSSLDLSSPSSLSSPPSSSPSANSSHKKKNKNNKEERESGEEEGQSFLCLLQYLYSDHCPIRENDQVAILKTAFSVGCARLISLCELYLSKTIEEETFNGIEKAKLDIVGLLNIAQANSASQLADFCLHFISSNYGPMQKREEWKNLSKANLKYIEEHKWPPQSYLDDIANYERAVAEAGGQDDKCSIM